VTDSDCEWCTPAGGSGSPALEQTDKGLDQIAGACGFSRADVMRRAFARALGTTPSR
jgi:transcriptional regulator GlxA family with amidase domain